MTLHIPNLDKLIAHLEAQPPERINMGCPYPARIPGSELTCGCVYVHVGELWIDETNFRFLGLSGPAETALTQPDGWNEERHGSRRYPAHRVIATLKRLRDRYLATGEIVVDWGPEPTAGEPWSAPRAVEITPPALPETLTRLFTAQREEA